MFYPFAFQLLASLGTNKDYYDAVLLPIPSELNLQRYYDLIVKPEVYQLMLNTMIRCVWYIGTTAVVALVAGYVFSKLRFKGRDAVFILFLSSMMVPGQVTLIPTYLIFARMPFAGGNDWMGQGGSGLLDTWGALLLGGLLPIYGIFLMKQSMESIPYDYEEAARIDGASVFRTIFRIYLPMMLPIICTLSIMTFIGIWNDYLWPLVAISSENMKVVATGFSRLIADFGNSGSVTQVPKYPEVFAVSTWMMIPPVIVYLWLQKYFIQGFAMTGVKG